jgi:hypothetical protein
MKRAVKTEVPEMGQTNSAVERQHIKRSPIPVVIYIQFPHRREVS